MKEAVRVEFSTFCVLIICISVFRCCIFNYVVIDIIHMLERNITALLLFEVAHKHDLDSSTVLASAYQCSLVQSPYSPTYVWNMM